MKCSAKSALMSGKKAEFKLALAANNSLKK